MSPVEVDRPTVMAQASTMTMAQTDKMIPTLISLYWTYRSRVKTATMEKTT
jgi:hypothetical protein